MGILIFNFLCTICLGSAADTTHYLGWLDDMFRSKLLLVEDDDKITGYYEIGQTLEFQLSGQRKADTLMLAEIDGDDNISGYLRLIEQGEKLSGIWSDRSGAVISMANFERDRGQFVRNKCSGNKWIKKLAREEHELLLMRMAGNQVGGYYLIPDEGRIAISGQCMDDWCTEIRFDGNTNLESIRFEGRDGMVRNTDKEVIERFRFVDSWSLECYTLINYYGSIDFVYPRIDRELENQMIARFRKWVAKWQSDIALEYTDTDFYPNERWANRSYGWLMIDYISDRFVSGVVELIDEKGGRDAFVFNYDLKEKQMLEPGEIFRGSGLPDELNGAGRYINFARDGVVVRQPFDIIFERALAFIPYNKLKGDIRRGFFDLITN